MSPIRSIRAAAAAICLLSAGIVKAFPPAQWVNSYGDSSGGSARCGAITVDAGGNVIVAGTYPASFRIRTLKLSAAGETLWQRFSGDATSGTQAEGKAVVTDPAGNIYVAGRFRNDSILMKYSSGGDLLWQKTWGTEETNEGADFVVIDNAGDIYVAGSGGIVSGNPASEDIFLIRYDSAGTEKWVRRYDGQAHGADHCGGLAAAGPGGGVFVTGSATEPAGVKFITLRYTSAGAAEWAKFYDEAGEVEQTPRLAPTTDGGVVLAGVSGEELAVVKYSLSGDQEWAQRVTVPPAPSQASGTGAASLLKCHGIAALANGRIAVLGYNYFSGGTSTLYRNGAYQVFAAGLNADGSLLPAKLLYFSSWDIGGYPFLEPMTLCAVQPSGFLAGMPGRVQAFDWLPDSGKTYAAEVNPSGSEMTLYYTARAVAGDTAGNLYFAAQGVADNDPLIRVGKFSSAPPPVPPVAVTAAADQIVSTGARLNGTLDNKQLASTWWFEYGPTTAYGSTTPVQQAGASVSVQNVSRTVTLQSGSAWHARLVASTAGGTRFGDDIVFSTPSSAWDLWADEAFGGHTGAGAFNGDFDGDGVLNGVEYSLGSSAVLSSEQPAIAAEPYTSEQSGITYLSIVYRPGASAPGATLQPEASDDLTSWHSTGVLILDLPEGRKRAVATGFEKFMRLKATQNP